jgi:hypothetical protein
VKTRPHASTLHSGVLDIECGKAKPDTGALPSTCNVVVGWKTHPVPAQIPCSVALLASSVASEGSCGLLMSTVFWGSCQDVIPALRCCLVVVLFYPIAGVPQLTTLASLHSGSPGYEGKLARPAASPWPQDCWRARATRRKQFCCFIFPRSSVILFPPFHSFFPPR